MKDKLWDKQTSVDTTLKGSTIAFFKVGSVLPPVEGNEYNRKQRNYLI